MHPEIVDPPVAAHPAEDVDRAQLGHQWEQMELFSPDAHTWTSRTATTCCSGSGSELASGTQSPAHKANMDSFGIVSDFAVILDDGRYFFDSKSGDHQ
jgi:hypothetical protein